MFPLHMHAPRGGWITPEITKLTFVRLFTCMGTFMFLQCCLFTKRSSAISADELLKKVSIISICKTHLKVMLRKELALTSVSYRFVMDFDHMVFQHALEGKFFSTVVTGVKQIFWMRVDTLYMLPKLLTSGIRIQDFCSLRILGCALRLQTQIMSVKNFVLFGTRIDCSSTAISDSMFVYLKY